MSINDPRISVNKLAEYMVSKAARQRKLLRDRKYPDPDFQMGMYHKEASEAIAAYLVGDQLNTRILILKYRLSSSKILAKSGLNGGLIQTLRLWSGFLTCLMTLILLTTCQRLALMLRRN